MKTIEKKEPYLNILDVQGNVYEHFTPDQVLTHKNLNKIVDFFEDQDRLSRIFLNGVGIGGGLNITKFTNDLIKIGQGFGITTDGDLVKAETSEFLSYTDLNDKGEYVLFKDMEVFELHTQEGAGRVKNELPLSSLQHLNHYIVLAYVENYTEDEGLCDGLGCDDFGEKVYSNLKFLITHKSNFAKLIGKDTIYNSHNVLAYYDRLPELCLPRILLNSSNTGSILEIHALYKNAILANELPSKLKDAILAVLENLKHRINFEKFGVKEFEIEELIKKLFNEQQLAFKNEKTIQYKYDLIKDLIETYHEIRNLLLNIHFECVPSIRSFPKHLVLGTLSETTRLQTRHRFYPSPINTGNDENLMSVRTLFIKFFNQLKEYTIPAFKSATIRVTPSYNYSFKLSQRSVPYYYKTKNALISNWNPTDKNNRKPLLQLGYHKENLKDIPCIQKPLEYSHLDKDFYRIEGHLGKNFKVALKNLQRQISDYNLPFDVKTISIDFPISMVNINDAKCDTKSYSTLLQSWEKEFCCTADGAINFFKEYKFSSIGDNFTSSRIDLKDLKPTEIIKPIEHISIPIPRPIPGIPTFDTPFPFPTDNLRKWMFKNPLVHKKPAPTPIKKGSLNFIMNIATRKIDATIFNAAHMENIALELFKEKSEVEASKEQIKFYIKTPIRIIADLTMVKRFFLKDLSSFYQTRKWEAFNNALNKLCGDLKKIIFDLSKTTDKTTFGDKKHDKMYKYFIYELLQLCCYKEKFNWLKSQLDEVRFNVYRELILSRLIQKYSGIEHMAGVSKGGTFIMVYPGGSVFSHNSLKEGIHYFGDKILFDFAVPYKCCSDCPPDTIVYQPMPEIFPTVTINPTVFCFIEGTPVAPVPIRITPEKGELTTPHGNEFIIGDIDNYSIDITKVPNNLLGNPISFKVNDTLVSNEHIVVYKLPKVVEPTYEFVKWTDEGLVVKLIIEHTLIAKNYFKYQWNRADGTTLTISKETGEALIKNSKKTINERISLTVTTNNREIECATKAILTVKESRPEIAISMKMIPAVFCMIEGRDIPKVPIEITPVNGVLSSTQNTTNFIQGTPGKYIFDANKVPKALLGKDIKFKVNGKNITTLVAKVYKIPKLIKVKKTVVSWLGSKLILNFAAQLTNSERQPYFTYHWSSKKDRNWKGVSKKLNGLISREVLAVTKFDDVVSLRISTNNPLAKCFNTGSIKIREAKIIRPLLFETPIIETPIIGTPVVGTAVFGTPVVGTAVFGTPIVGTAFMSPLELSCTMTYKQRFGTFKTSSILNNITSRGLRPIGLKGKVITPLLKKSATLNKTALAKFSQLVFIRTQFSELNKLRNILLKEFIKKSNSVSNTTQFLLVDQVLELIGLELLRCKSINSIEMRSLTPILKQFFLFSKGTSDLLSRNRKLRTFANKKYSLAYKPKSNSVKTLFKANIK